MLEENTTPEANPTQEPEITTSGPVPRPLDLAAGTAPQTSRTLPPRGSHRYLAGFMDDNHLAMYTAKVLGNLTASEKDEFKARHLRTRQAAGQLAPLAVDRVEEQLVPLDDRYASWIKEVEESAIFQRSFAPVPYAFRSVPICTLGTFQPFLKKLHYEIPDDEEGVLKVCLPKEFRSTADCQMNQAAGGVQLLFYGDDPDAELSIDTEPGGTVRLHVDARPNWVQVALCQGRLLVRNGYHRIASLFARGVDRVPALVVQIDDPFQVVPQGPWFSAPYLYGSQRPPLLTDFFNPELTLDVQQPDVRGVVEVRMNVAKFTLPR
jgi:hypothetical protein